MFTYNFLIQHQIATCGTIWLMSKETQPFESVVIGRLGRPLLVGAALYVVMCVGCASFQRKMLYFPPHLTSEQVAESARTAGLQRWSAPSGQAIGMKRLSPRQPATGQV